MQQDVPVVKSELAASDPADEQCSVCKLRNSDQKPTETLVDGTAHSYLENVKSAGI